MPFLQGQHACLLLTGAELDHFAETLASLGYAPHTGLRTRRRGEIGSWVGRLRRGGQIHVQAAAGARGYVEIYAHAEPAGYGLEHLMWAVLDAPSYRHGARLLLADLRSQGWDVDRYRPRLM
ncbi:MAG: hypothetical protein HY744_03350 [Deltaproteobacteria bacterium]|nr:hypothetical protein [Deltaproteobacteria bacterium]